MQSHGVPSTTIVLGQEKIPTCEVLNKERPVIRPKSLPTTEANYSEFLVCEMPVKIYAPFAREKPWSSPGAFKSKPINAFAVALCDNIVRIRDVVDWLKRSS
ncbi:hypothetical protein M0804_007822 [Polistes exclamans]|nr:hypothetical protein M0804_007822 [Polistes exclamans]